MLNAALFSNRSFESTYLLEKAALQLVTVKTLQCNDDEIILITENAFEPQAKNRIAGEETW